MAVAQGVSHIGDAEIRWRERKACRTHIDHDAAIRAQTPQTVSGSPFGLMSLPNGLMTMPLFRGPEAVSFTPVGDRRS